MKLSSEKTLLELKEYIEEEKYQGWDPYDFLNSEILQKSYFFKYSLIRLIFIQLGKRSPVNLRRLFKVDKGFNSKGLALILMGYINLYQISKKGSEEFGRPEELKEKIEYVANLLLDKSIAGYSGSCWGYNFPWQARNLFYFPTETPTIVATAFCSESLFKAYEVTKKKVFLDAAISSSKFILNDLNKVFDGESYILSYSPLPGNDTVFNASALGAKILAYCYKYTDNVEYKIEAEKIVTFITDRQGKDGSWIYGLNKVQNWKDSFHTGYVLEAISKYQQLCNDKKFNNNLIKGFTFYIKNFFNEDGLPKYYDKAVYPVDIHCPAQLWITLKALDNFKDNKYLAESVLNWTLKNLYSGEGFFYYQKKRYLTNRLSYMRWSNAFMFNGLSIYQNLKDEI
tara:strand:- start:677 stop:1870 length:1194 start_codon:yes stop_codon:yes gene_type:complete